MAQCPDGRERVFSGINQVLGQRANDAISTGIDLAYLSLLLARGFDKARCRCIDDCGYPPGLSIKSIFCCHVSPPDYLNLL